MGCVRPFDVERRVGLRITARLRLGEHVGEIAAGIFHRRKDEIAGAVEDPVDALDRIGGSALTQPLDHRDTAGHRRLELQRHPRRFRLGRKFEAVVSDHRLVGGDQRLAGLDGAAGKCQGRAISPADQLNDHVDIAPLAHDDHVVFPSVVRKVHAPLLGAITGADGSNLDRPASPPGNKVRVGFDQADHACPHGSQSCKRDTKRFGHVHPFRAAP